MKINVLQCKKFSYTYKTDNFPNRTVKDYEIDFELCEGRHYQYHDQNSSIALTLPENCVLIRKPGGSVSSYGSQNSYLLTISLSGEKAPPTGFGRNLPGKIASLCNDALLDDLPPVVVMKNHLEVKEIYQKLTQIPLDDENAKNLVLQLIHLINAQIYQDKFNNNLDKKTPCDLIYNYLKNNFNRQISLDQLANAVHLEKSYLIRLFYSKYNKTPIQTLIDFRLEHALLLVLESDMKISDISDNCGFNTLSFFIKQYKLKYGLTPLEHRKKIIEKPLA